MRGKLVVIGVVGAAALVAAAVSTDRGRSATDPLEECVDYAAAVRRCFPGKSERSTIVATTPPTARADRDAARKRCVDARARIEKACR